MSSASSVTLAMPSVGPGSQPPFTAAQWHELEHQALIFKYLKAGLRVPPQLLTPIHKSCQSLWPTFYHHLTLGCSYFGKKVDPDPGRCRRTDGKKWRCSKDAYPDSKYCERHMNRGRYRSRKPVESQSASQSLPAVALDVDTGCSSGNISFRNVSSHSSATRESLSFGGSVPQLPMESPTNMEYRCLRGLNSEADNPKFVSVTSGSISCLGRNSTIDNAWRIMKSQDPSSSLSDSRNGAILRSGCSMLQMPQEFEQQQHYFFGKEFGSPGTAQLEHQSLPTLSNQLPKGRDVGTYLNYPMANSN
ncbi:WRC domain-containing protein/QLQ domain-containing protein, partial [Cephalotus follicularis]